MKQHQTTSWNLADEMRFLDSCGTVSDKRLALLGYLCAPYPDHWTQEELASLKAYAERLLRGEKK